MDNNWYDINIDVSDALKPDWKFPEIKNKTDQVWRYHYTDILNPDWVARTEALLGFKWGVVMVFWKTKWWAPNYAHIDLYDAGGASQFGLNFIVGGAGSEMRWYQPPEEIIESPRTAAGTRHCLLPIKELKHIDSYTVGTNKLSLVRVGIPHEIYTGSEERWCISLRTRHPIGTTWEYIEKLLRDKNLLIEKK